MKQKQKAQLHSFVDHSSIEWHASQCPVSSSKPSSWPRSQQITVLQTSHSACNSDVRANAPTVWRSHLGAFVLRCGRSFCGFSASEDEVSVRLEVIVPFTQTAEEQYVLMCFDTFVVYVCVHWERVCASSHIWIWLLMCIFCQLGKGSPVTFTAAFTLLDYKPISWHDTRLKITFIFEWKKQLTISEQILLSAHLIMHSAHLSNH